MVLVMSFQERFQRGAVKFNERVKEDPNFKSFLEKYHGKMLVLKIRDDATYVLTITLTGLSLEVSPPTLPDGPEVMYLEMDTEHLKRLIEEHTVNPADLLFGKIKWKNIGLKEVDIVRKMIGA